MGFMSKLKDVFYDKVEVEDSEEEEIKVKEKEEKISAPKVEEIKREVPVKEEEIIEEPIKEEEKSVNTFSERDLFRNERTFNFTEFDDTDELPPRKSVLDLEDTKPVLQKTTVESPKVFKPSPIISPIYGILDKDYKKEEVTERTTVGTEPLTSTVTTYDTVRRKAYGTLEDDLEDTLNSMNKITTTSINIKMEEKPTKEKVDDIKEKTQNIEDLITRIEETTNDIDRTLSIGQLEDTAELENFEEDDNDAVIGGPAEEVEPEPKHEAEPEEELDRTMTDSTLEHDLFNLIDSMYDDKED